MSYVSTSYIWIKIPHTEYTEWDAKLTESEKNLGWEGPLEVICSKQGQLQSLIRLLRVFYCWVLTVSKDGDYTASLGNPTWATTSGGQCLTCLVNFFSLYPVRISPATTCGCHFFPFCCTPVGRVWCHIFWVYLPSRRTNSVVSAFPYTSC